jgi:hypothetical protein
VSAHGSIGEEVIGRARGAAVVIKRPNTYHLEWWRGETEDVVINNLPLVIKISGPLDVEVLRRALGRLAERHEVLRSAIEPDGCYVYPTCEVEMAHGSCDEGDVGTYAWQKTRMEAFSLSVPPLWRTELVTTERATYLVCVFSHLVFDLASRAVVVHDLAALYADLIGEGRGLLPRAGQYGDVAEWERSQPFGEREWWRSALDVEPPVWRPRPTDGPVWLRGPNVKLVGGGSAPIPAVAGAGPAAVLRALVAGSLAEDFPSGDMVLGTIQARRHGAARFAIGPLADWLPLPVHVAGATTVEELVTRSRAANAAARSRWPQSAFPIIQDAGRALGRDPDGLVQVLINYLPTPPHFGWAMAGPRVRFEQVAIPNRMPDELLGGPTTSPTLIFDLWVDARTSRLTDFDVRGPSDVFADDQLAAKAERFEAAVRRLTANT